MLYTMLRALNEFDMQVYSKAHDALVEHATGLLHGRGSRSRSEDGPSPEEELAAAR